MEFFIEYILIFYQSGHYRLSKSRFNSKTLEIKLKFAKKSWKMLFSAGFLALAQKKPPGWAKKPKMTVFFYDFLHIWALFDVFMGCNYCYWSSNVYLGVTYYVRNQRAQLFKKKTFIAQKTEFWAIFCYPFEFFDEWAQSTMIIISKVYSRPKLRYQEY